MQACYKGMHALTSYSAHSAIAAPRLAVVSVASARIWCNCTGVGGRVALAAGAGAIGGVAGDLRDASTHFLRNNAYAAMQRIVGPLPCTRCCSARASGEQQPTLQVPAWQRPVFPSAVLQVPANVTGSQDPELVLHAWHGPGQLVLASQVACRTKPTLVSLARSPLCLVVCRSM